MERFTALANHATAAFQGTRRDQIDFTTIVSRTTSGLYNPATDAAAGVGGNADRCWCASLLKVFRLNPDTLALVASQPTGLGSAGLDIGGSTTRVWFSHLSSAHVYEFDPGPPPTVVRSAIAPGDSHAQGIDGDDSVVWALGFVGAAQHIFELDPADLSVVRDGGAIVNTAEQGCGGGAKAI